MPPWIATTPIVSTKLRKWINIQASGFRQALIKGASRVSLELGDNSWYLAREFTANEDLVLDGVNKIFLLGGKNITGEMTWEDFPYLTPGENHVGIYINTIGVTRGVEIRYRPTFL